MGIFKSLGMISLGFLCAPLAWSAPLFTTATRNQPLNCETLLKSNLSKVINYDNVQSMGVLGEVFDLYRHANEQAALKLYRLANRQAALQRARQAVESVVSYRQRTVDEPKKIFDAITAHPRGFAERFSSELDRMRARLSDRTSPNFIVFDGRMDEDSTELAEVILMKLSLGRAAKTAARPVASSVLLVYRFPKNSEELLRVLFHELTHLDDYILFETFVAKNQSLPLQAQHPLYTRYYNQGSQKWRPDFEEFVYEGHAHYIELNLLPEILTRLQENVSARTPEAVTAAVRNRTQIFIESLFKGYPELTTFANSLRIDTSGRDHRGLQAVMTQSRNVIEQMRAFVGWESNSASR